MFSFGRLDTDHNDNQRNDTQRHDTQHKEIKYIPEDEWQSA
jgi:hypothetical protein